MLDNVDNNIYTVDTWVCILDEWLFSGVVRHYMEHVVIVVTLEFMSCEIPGCCGILWPFDG